MGPKKKETEESIGGTYDRLVICDFDMDVPFNSVTADIRDANYDLWIDKIKKEFNPLESIHTYNRTKEFKFQDAFTGEERTIRVFARVERGVPQRRLDMILDDLNEEITAGASTSLLLDYIRMIELWYEKIPKDFDYIPRKTATDKFVFKRIDRVTTRRDINQGIPITDESATEQSSSKANKVTQMALKSGAKASNDEPAIKIAKDKPKKKTSKTSDLDKSQDDLLQPSDELLGTISLDTTVELVPGTSFIDPDQIIMDHIAEDQAKGLYVVTTAGTTESTPALVRCDAMTPSQVVVQFSDEAIMAAIKSATDATKDAAEEALEKAAEEALQNAQKALDEDAQRANLEEEQQQVEDTPLPTYSQDDDPPFESSSEVAATHVPVVIRSSTSHEDLKVYIDNAVITLTNLINEKFEKLNKKLDNKFLGMKEVKTMTRNIQENVSSLSLNEGARLSSQAAVLGNAENKSKAWGILFRLIPFNKMGKSADIFFSFHFVQEQLVDFLAPHLQGLSDKGMNIFIARTTLNNLFTELARAHLIYGLVKNSLRCCTFIKRPLMKGYFNMVFKGLVPRIREAKRYHPQESVDNFCDIMSTCAQSFGNDYGSYVTQAAQQFKDVDACVNFIMKTDRMFYEANKHILPSAVVPMTEEEHRAQVAGRKEIEKVFKLRKAEDKEREYPPEEKVLADMSANAGIVADENETLDIIMAAAYLQGYDPFNLTFDPISKMPEIAKLYEDAKMRNKDILSLVKAYSADARNNIPEIVVEDTVRRSNRRKKQDQQEPSTSGTSTTPAKRRRTSSVSPRKCYPFSQHTDEKLNQAARKRIADEFADEDSCSSGEEFLDSANNMRRQMALAKEIAANNKKAEERVRKERAAKEKAAKDEATRPKETPPVESRVATPDEGEGNAPEFVDEEGIITPPKK